MHIHGGGGGSFITADVTSDLRAVSTHRRHGTTTTMASLVTASPEQLLRSVSMLAHLFDEDVIAGIHLEGPWTSADWRGAHDRAQLREPEPAEISRLLTAGRGTIQMVTVAPEVTGGRRCPRRHSSDQRHAAPAPPPSRAGRRAA